MISDYYEDFVLLGRVEKADGLGGMTTAWSEDTGFRGGLTSVSGMEIIPGGVSRLKETPVLCHENGITLHLNDCVKRVRDGARYRVVSDSDEMRTPSCAGFSYAQVRVERLVDGV